MPPDDDVPPLARPVTVLAGCIMAWLGAVTGLVLALFFLSVSSDSATIKSVAAADRADLVAAFHLVGGIHAVWCPLVIVVAFFAFKGAKWAALTLVGMATIYVLWSIYSLGSAAAGFGLVWTVVSAVLAYAVRPSRDWFNAMSAAKR